MMWSTEVLKTPSTSSIDAPVAQTEAASTVRARSEARRPRVAAAPLATPAAENLLSSEAVDRVVPPFERTVDLAAAEQAAAAFMDALGLDRETPGTKATPWRMARAYAELVNRETFTMTTFPNDSDHHELVISRGISFHALCEHHLLPFVGVAHVGYVPAERIIGLSKLARCVRAAAARPQVQERLTDEVADLLFSSAAPHGAGVVVEAEHWCMSLRGVQAGGARTRTTALRGTLLTDERRRTEFLSVTS